MDTLSFRCSTCKLDKPVTDFHKNKSRKTGYSSECKPCVLGRRKRNYDANPEKHRIKANRRYWSDSTKAKQIIKDYRQRNPDAVKATQKKYKAANKDAIRAQERIWTERNREKVRGFGRKRRALKKGVPSEPYTSGDILARWGTDCHLCKEPIDLTVHRKHPRGLHLDHVMPLSKGGFDLISNVKPAHAFCNISKKDKLIQ